jgi:NADP-dependent 3-hydroxy acid dehydrogenase YdfG
MTRPIALVTGGSRGIGLAVARDLGRDHHVLVGGTQAERVAATVRELPSAEPFLVDVSDPAALAAATSPIDRLDVLVHSAGISVNGPISEVGHDDWVRVLAVNVVAVADLTRLLLPALRATNGQVIAINSGSGFTAWPESGPYAASKFALRAITDALREEERGRIRVTSIHPGRVDTDMQRQIQSARGREYDAGIYLTPESVARTVRLAVDATDEAMVEQLSIRPVVKS